MVAHTFTCPQGLYFNSLTDGCDFRRNVDCEGKDDTEEDAESTEGTTSRTTSASASTKSGDEPETLEDVLAQIKAAGNVSNDNILFHSWLHYYIVLRPSSIM